MQTMSFGGNPSSSGMRRTAGDNTLRILLVQQFFPAYRIPVFSKLASHPAVELTLLHGTEGGIAPGERGLQNVEAEMPFRVVQARIRRLGFRGKAVLWFSEAVDLVRSERFDVVIHNFATRWASLGKTRRLQQRKGHKFILWGIGFSQTATPFLDMLRVQMVHRADAAILYSDTARARYMRLGSLPNKLFVARNCVQFSSIEKAMAACTRARLADFRRRYGIDQAPVLLSVGRIAENKRLDLLIKAGSILRSSWKDLRIVLIGEGPEKIALQRLARDMRLDGCVIFPGAITDERELAPWFLSSDLVVAPGQIGLLAIHAAAYGRPLVTSDNPVMHGPEVETFVPDVTGSSYTYGNAGELAERLAYVLSNGDRRAQFGKNAYAHIRKECGVGKMVNGVLKAISCVMDRKLELFDPYP